MTSTPIVCAQITFLFGRFRLISRGLGQLWALSYSSCAQVCVRPLPESHYYFILVY
jgi:hypothetical protein